MTTKHEVLALFRKHPTWTSVELATKLGCHDAYVRTTLKRANLKLHQSHNGMAGLAVLERRAASVQKKLARIEQHIRDLEAAREAQRATLQNVNAEIQRRYGARISAQQSQAA